MSKIRCTHCNKILNPKKIKYLELSQTDGLYYGEESGIPEGHISQGNFPFGFACATKELFHTFQKYQQKVRDFEIR